MNTLSEKIKRNWKRFQNIRTQSEHGYLGSILYIWRLKRQRGFIFTEIHDNELDLNGREYEESFLNWKEQKRYLDLLNPRKYYSLARNKFLTHLILDSLGITAKAELYCYYDPELRTPENTRCSWDLPSTMSLLKSATNGCVVKTTESSHGDNVWVFKSVELTDTDALMDRFDGKTIRLSELLGKTPLVFESIIRQSEQMSGFNPDSVNTIRFMTTLHPSGEAKIIATFIKIGRAGRCVDNAGGGGNVDAAVDTASGKIYNTIEFRGWRNHPHIERHPDSGTQIEGIVIDNWEGICEKVKSFQRAIPFVKAAGWDIAITDNGPIIIEVNDMWDRTGQLFIGRGWHREIKECYDAWKSYYNNM